jgi:hypothetical protein
MKRSVILVLIFLGGTQNIMASQPKGEYIIIWNNSTKNILIEKTFHAFNEGEWMEIEGLNISKLDYPYRIIFPNEQKVCLAYYPAYGLFEAIEKNFFKKLAMIPLVDKLNAIFLEFRIMDTEGNILYDITNMKDDNFIVEHYDDAYTIQYILEISD